MELPVDFDVPVPEPVLFGQVLLVDPVPVEPVPVEPVPLPDAEPDPLLYLPPVDPAEPVPVEPVPVEPVPVEPDPVEPSC